MPDYTISWDQLVNQITPTGTTDGKWKDNMNGLVQPPNVKGPKDAQGKDTNIPNIEDPAWDKAKWENTELTVTIPKIEDLEKAIKAKEEEAAKDPEMSCEQACIKNVTDSTEKCNILKRRMELFMLQSGCNATCTIKPKPMPQQPGCAAGGAAGGTTGYGNTDDMAVVYSNQNQG